MKKMLLCAIAMSGLVNVTHAEAKTNAPTITYKVTVINGRTHLNGTNMSELVSRESHLPLKTQPHEDVNIVEDDINNVDSIIESSMSDVASTEKQFHDITQGTSIYVKYRKPRLDVIPYDTDDEYQYENKNMKFVASGHVYGDSVKLHFTASFNDEKKSGTIQIPDGGTAFMPFHMDSTDKSYQQYILIEPDIN